MLTRIEQLEKEVADLKASGRLILKQEMERTAECIRLRDINTGQAEALQTMRVRLKNIEKGTALCQVISNYINMDATHALEVLLLEVLFGPTKEQAQAALRELQSLLVGKH
jgi:hypothetical protein